MTYKPFTLLDLLILGPDLALLDVKVRLVLVLVGNQAVTAACRAAAFPCPRGSEDYEDHATDWRNIDILNLMHLVLQLN